VPDVRYLLKSVTVRVADAESMSGGGLHDHPFIYAGYDSCAQLLQARNLRLYRVSLDIEVRSRFVTDFLNDDLDVAGRRYKLDEVTSLIHNFRQGIAECGAPEPGIGQQVLSPTIDDNISESASMHLCPCDAEHVVGCSHSRRSFGYGCRIHPHRLPDMAVGVCKVAVIHEAQILGRIDVRSAAVRGSRLVHRINRLTTVARQG
jgi:hypothetical protein